MDKGDALIIIGSVWHGGGVNISDERRNTYSVHMVRGTMRQDENQFSAIPHETAKNLSSEVQAIIGYSVSQPYCGYVEMDDSVKTLQENANFARHDLQGFICEGPGSENFTGEKPELPAVATK